MAGVRYPIEIVRDVPVVAAPEEIDVSNAGLLQAVLGEAAALGHGTFVVDMTGVRFCASAGLGALVRAHNRAVADGGELRLVVPASALVLRVFAVSGLDRVIPNFADLDEALQPAPAAPSPPRPRRRRRPKPGMRTRADRPPADPGARPSPVLRSTRSEGGQGRPRAVVDDRWSMTRVLWLPPWVDDGSIRIRPRKAGRLWRRSLASGSWREPSRASPRSSRAHFYHQ
jgi:anti-sigma B factor antagonist